MSSDVKIIKIEIVVTCPQCGEKVTAHPMTSHTEFSNRCPHCHTFIRFDVEVDAEVEVDR